VGYWRDHKGQVIVGTMGALLVAGVTALLTGSLPSDSASAPSSGDPPTSISSAAELAAYVRAQSLWSDHPTTFPTTLELAVSEQSSSRHAVTVSLNAARTDVVAHSVGFLADDGASVNFSVIIVVGRVRSASISAAVWKHQGVAMSGPDHDTLLESQNGRNLIYGLVGGQLKRNTVVYFPGVVVAVGHTARDAATAYVVGLAPVSTRRPGSGTIRTLVASYDRAAH
jgi:hypothetical protein